MLAGDPDVLLGEVAGVSRQCRGLWQLGADRFEVLIELVERRLAAGWASGAWSEISAATITCAVESTIA